MLPTTVFHWTKKLMFWCLLAIGTPMLAIDLTPSLGEYARSEISVGAEYTSGKYGGATSTDIWYIPLTLR